jgi:hypothetical protein
MRFALKGERKQNDLLEGNLRYCGVAAICAAGAAVVGGIASNSAANKAQDSANAAINANAYQGQIATDQWNTYKNTYQPMENQMVSTAQNFDSQANEDQAAGSAQADVSSQIGQAQANLARTPGLDPSSAAAQAANTDLQIKGAAMGATAQTQARTNIKNEAWGRQMDSLGLGKGLVTNASTGLANAANGAMAVASNQQRLASQTATGMGALTSNLIGVAGRANWGSPLSTAPNPTTTENMYSGGNDGWTDAGGESLGT